MLSTQPLSAWQWDTRQIVTGDVNRSENHFMNSDGDLNGLTSGAPFVNTARNVSAPKWANDDPRNLTNFVMAKAEGNSLKGWRYLGIFFTFLRTCPCRPMPEMMHISFMRTT